MRLFSFAIGGSILLGVFVFLKNPTSKIVQNRPVNIILIMSDDQSWHHTGINGDRVVQTPYFDQIAKSGVNFTNNYCSAPACAPSRASMLAGRNFWELGRGAIHFSDFPSDLIIFTDLLAENGYEVGYTGKAWGPGRWKETRERDPSGEKIQNAFYSDVPMGINENYYAANFREFHKELEADEPFFFWLGTTEPHRKMAEGMGIKSGTDLEEINVPEFLPDDPTIRSDIADYYYEINWMDKQLGEVYEYLNEKDELRNTIFIITSDNGMPFPRAKSNLYDHGARLPLAISFPNHIPGNRTVTDFVGLKDLAPTILDYAGVPIPEEMTGMSLKSLLESMENGRVTSERDHMVMGKELHAWCHPKGEINPVRGIRTDEYLYIQNLKPEMWPAGHPDRQYAWDLAPYGDVDGSPSKTLLLENEQKFPKEYAMAFGKRPPEELYDVVNDPFQLNNLSFKPGYQDIKQELASKMNAYLKQTGDPRTLGDASVFDKAPYYWSHGLETAGLPPYLWDPLSEADRQAKVDSVANALQVN